MHLIQKSFIFLYAFFLFSVGSTPVTRGRKKHSYTPRTKRRISTLQRSNTKYRKALSRLGKQSKHEKGGEEVSKRDALSGIKPFVSDKFFRILDTSLPRMCNKIRYSLLITANVRHFHFHIDFVAASS